MLRMYYARLFPFEFMFEWLSYGNDPAGKTEEGNEPLFFAKREWSFTIQPTPTDEIYIRYQSFRDCKELREAVQKRQPNKIDIGAVFTHKPSEHKTLKSDVFHTVERELVFDIDLTDYDCVRTCCTGANICNRCWTYMTCACKTVDVGLREDFGFQKIAWFYSGRRGVHCWVADEAARTLSNEGRSAVAMYFELPLENQEKGLDLTPNLHPMLRRSFETLEPMFLNNIIGENGMKLLSDQESWVKVLKTLPDAARSAGIAASLDKKWSTTVSSEKQKWSDIKKHLSDFVAKNKAPGKAQSSVSPKQRDEIEMWSYETVFRHTYPRLDINVSKMQNHLLKSPFCVHPKTGRVCVPMDVGKIDEFDPFAVPTLPQVIKEMGDYDNQHGEAAKKMPDWMKTSLKAPFQQFQRNFLNPLKNEAVARKREAADKAAAGGGGEGW
jgi:DNA primase small subunit